MQMTADDLVLLGRFVRDQSEEAFTTLVGRHLGLVYSAALRQVRSAALAEEIAQMVFTNLAQEAPRLRPDTVLTAWLYQVTRRTAIDVVRREARRQAREQIALQMSEMNECSTDWTQIEPILDEAMDSLEEADRTAILLRYFENKSLREVGLARGASEDAAQKRVARALEKLREFFDRRKVTLGAAGLAAMVSANAIEAAPAALAGKVGAGALLAVRGLAASSAIITTKSIGILMTTTQKILACVLLAGAVAAGFYEFHQAGQWREQRQALEQPKAEIADLTRQRDGAKKEVERMAAENQALKARPSEVVKLRGEVGRLRSAKEALGAKSALSKLTASPEARNLVRDQQKAGMAALYKGLADQLKLSPEMSGKLNDALADGVMDNIDAITTVLRDKPGKDQMDRVFASQQAALEAKLTDLLGPEGAAKFNDYNQALLGGLVSDQFKDQLSGTAEEKSAKSQQLAKLVQEEATAARANAGLPSNYQVAPILNFENIASEQQGDQGLSLLGSIYQGVEARATDFLNADEIAKLQDMAGKSLTNSRLVLNMNRSLMAPISN
jgi:RNA polymerase sigma factor (sigma-70 family)